MTIPEPSQALVLPTEELAGYLVLHHKTMSQFNVHNVMCNLDSNSGSLPSDRQQRELYKDALMEAYSWAFTEGLFILDPNQMQNNWWKVSRKGRKLNTPLDALELASREILPKAFLHPLISEHAAPIFQMGKYDAAVFQAFKQVEIAVRDKSKLSSDGTTLMKTAFNKDNGKLNTETNPSEKEGLMFVFAGAIQLFRNPPGHKNVVFEPKQAAHLLIHASYLLEGWQRFT